MTEQRRLHVIIAGGGVAGLALANCLQAARIDYTLLEARKDIAPQVGASIATFPNGVRILDQLGCLDAINRNAFPVAFVGTHYTNGDHIQPPVDAPQLSTAR